MTPGRIAIKVNGEERLLDLKQPGLSRVRFPVSCPDGVVRISLLALSGESRLICDAQRNYRRSELNGNALPGEWVMRLYPLPEKEVPTPDRSGGFSGNRNTPVEK